MTRAGQNDGKVSPEIPPVGCPLPLPLRLPLPRQERRHALAGEFVGALVHCVAGVAVDPAPVDRVARRAGVEPAPQVFVLDRLLVGGAPAVALPAVNPLRHAAAQILRVGVQLDRARAGQRLQRHDRRHDLHAVVGRQRLAAAQRLLALAPGEDRAPAAGAGVA